MVNLPSFKLYLGKVVDLSISLPLYWKMFPINKTTLLCWWSSEE